MILEEKELEEIIFDKFIQTSIQIISLDTDNNSNILRRGRLINFNIKQSFLHFKIDLKNKIRNYYLPYPFICKLHGADLILDYKIENMCNDENIVDRLFEYGITSESKIFNKQVYLKIVDE